MCTPMEVGELEQYVIVISVLLVFLQAQAEQRALCVHRLPFYPGDNIIE